MHFEQTLAQMFHITSCNPCISTTQQCSSFQDWFHGLAQS